MISREAANRRDGREGPWSVAVSTRFDGGGDQTAGVASLILGLDELGGDLKLIPAESAAVRAFIARLDGAILIDSEPRERSAALPSVPWGR